MIYFLVSFALAFFLWKATSSFWRQSKDGTETTGTGGHQSRCFSQDRDAPCPTRPPSTSFKLAEPQNITVKEPEGNEIPLIMEHKEGDKTVWVGTVHLGGAQEGDGDSSFLSICTPNPMMQERDEMLRARSRDVSPLKPESERSVSPTMEAEGGSLLQLVSVETRCRVEEHMTSFVGENRSNDLLELCSQRNKEEMGLEEGLLEYGSSTSGEKTPRYRSQTSIGELLQDHPKTSSEVILESSQTAGGELDKDSSQSTDSLEDFQIPEKEVFDDRQTTGGYSLEEGFQNFREELLVDDSQTSGEGIDRDVSEPPGKEIVEKWSQTQGQEPPECNFPSKKKLAGGIRLFGGAELLDKIQKRRIALEHAEQSGPPGASKMPTNLENITCVEKDATTESEEPLTIEPHINSLTLEGATKDNDRLTSACVVHEPRTGPTSLAAELGSISDETSTLKENLSPPWEGDLFSPTEGEALIHLNKDRPRGPAKRRPSFNTGRT